jgi:hypothetical protein
MTHLRRFTFAAFWGLLWALASAPALAQTKTADLDAKPTTPPASADAASASTPAELSLYGRQWAPKGRGTLRFFGFKAYDATLWLQGPNASFGFDKPFALEIRYATSVKGKDIANTSLVELQRVSPSSPEQIAAWSAFMDSIFVDVKAGDQLTGVHLPIAGVRFFLNGKLAGESSDTAFSEAFFKIWLDPKTKRPELRNALLASSEAASK